MSESDYPETDIFPENDPSERGKLTHEDLELREAIRVRLAARRHRSVLPPGLSTGTLGFRPWRSNIRHDRRPADHRPGRPLSHPARAGAGRHGGGVPGR